MSTIVVYDSTYGNTEKLAKSMGDAMAAGTKVTRANEVNPSDLGRGRLTDNRFSDSGRQAYAFDSNLPGKVFRQDKRCRRCRVRFAAFRKMGRVFGYASNKIANSLKQSGGNLIAPPGGFFVKGKSGPLKDEEIEHAADWAKAIVENRKKG